MACGSATYFVPVPNTLEYPLYFTNSSCNSICVENHQLFLKHLKNYTLWAYQMWDASAKVTANLATGNTYELGDFDECLSITKPFQAHYCLMQIRLNFQNVSNEVSYTVGDDPYISIYKKFYYTGDIFQVKRDLLLWGYCIPYSCTLAELETSLDNFLHLNSNLHISYVVQVQKSKCYSAEDVQSFTPQNYGFCILLASIMFVVLFITIYHINYIDGKEIKETKLSKIIAHISIKTNLLELTKLEGKTNAFNIFYGIKSMLIAGIIFSHTLFSYFSKPLMNYNHIEEVNRSMLLTLITRGEVSIDVCFLISGLLFSYNYLHVSESHSVNFIRSCVLRYVRLVPLLAFMTFFYTSILYKLGFGPIWDLSVGQEVKYCYKNWWTNLVLVNNIYDVKNMCILPGWYIAAEVHFYILFFPVNNLIKRNTKLCWVIISIVLFATMALPFLVVYFDGKMPLIVINNNVLYNFREQYAFVSVYLPTYNRSSPFIIGMMFGFFYYKRTIKPLELSCVTSTILMSLGTLLIFACTLSSQVFLDPSWKHSPLELAFYTALYRPICAFASALIIISIGFGKKGAFQTLLMSKPMVVLAKLSFALHLIHFPILFIRNGLFRSLTRYTVFDLICETIIIFVLSLPMSLMAYLFIEVPAIKTMKEVIPRDPCNIKSKHHMDLFRRAEDSVPN